MRRRPQTFTGHSRQQTQEEDAALGAISPARASSSRAGGLRLAGGLPQCWIAGPRGGWELALTAHPQAPQPQPLSSKAGERQSKLSTWEPEAPINRGLQGWEAPARITKVIGLQVPERASKGSGGGLSTMVAVSPCPLHQETTQVPQGGRSRPRAMSPPLSPRPPHSSDPARPLQQSHNPVLSPLPTSPHATQNLRTSTPGPATPPCTGLHLPGPTGYSLGSLRQRDGSQCPCNSWCMDPGGPPVTGPLSCSPKGLVLLVPVQWQARPQEHVHVAP